MNEIIINVYNDEVNVGVEEIIETVTIVITENAGVPSEAPIETASANGVPIPIVNKNIDIIIPTKTSDLEKDDVYTKTEINNKLSAVYKFKGSVLTYAELPIDAENADVYNVEENGVNYAWVEATESWDSLGGLIGLATLTENGLMSKEDFAKLVNLSGTNTGDETQDSLGEKIEITELESITDTTKIAASDSAFLKWFSGLRIKTFLTGFFAKLSGGNIFSGKQDFDGMINHKAGEYFYTAASKTADTVNDTRVINTVGVEIHSICTALGATKGSGTWIPTFQIDNTNKKISVGNNVPDWTFQLGKLKMKAENGFMYADIDNVLTNGWYFGTRLLRTDGQLIVGSGGKGFSAMTNGIYTNGMFNAIDFDTNGKIYNAASPTADTINDTRTSNQSGVKIEEICTAVLVGGANVKGSGTWIPTFKIDKNGFLLDQYDDIMPGMGWVDAAGGAAPDTEAHTIAGIAVNFKAFDGNNTTEAMTNAIEITHAIDVDALNRVTEPLVAEIHTHGMAATTGSGIVKIFYDLVYQPVNAAPIAWGTFYNLITINANEQYWHKLGGVELTKPSSGFAIGDQIIVKYYRVPTDAQDTYAGDWLFKQCAMHMPLNSNGSRTRYAK